MDATAKRWKDCYSSYFFYFNVSGIDETFKFHLKLLNLKIEHKLCSVFLLLTQCILYWCHIDIGNRSFGFTHCYNGKKIIRFLLRRSSEETAQLRLFRIIPEQTAEKLSNQSFKEKLAL